MRHFVYIGLVALALGTAQARAQEADSEIRSVISAQIEAFLADDFETAFSFASPAIKQMFGSSDRFGEMVQNGYPMVWRPANVQFSGLETRSGRTVQSVVVRDQAGAVYVLDYEMVPTESGWQINGVMVRRTGDAGA